MKRSQRQKTQREPQAIDRSQNPKATKFPTILPKTENQKYFFESLAEDIISVVTGYAGTGKTFIACGQAAKKLFTGQTKKIVLIRAYQPLANRSIGFLPGTAEEKLMPYYRQMVDYLEDFLTKGRVDIYLREGTIEICSLETIRGRSWDDCTIIVDEAQNIYPEEIQALVTRVGQNSQMILLGDGSGIQQDVSDNKNGLAYLIDIADKYNIEGVGITELGVNDIVRSDITREFVIAFDRELQMQKKETKGVRK